MMLYLMLMYFVSVAVVHLDRKKMRKSLAEDKEGVENSIFTLDTLVNINIWTPVLNTLLMICVVIEFIIDTVRKIRYWIYRLIKKITKK